MNLGVVVVAAGSGVRLGAGSAKALVRVAGRCLVDHAVSRLAQAGLPPPVIVHPAGAEAQFRRAVADPVAGWVNGGDQRRDSVRAGTAALPADVDVVVIHDAARAFTPVGVIREAVTAVTAAPGVLAAAPATPVVDTLKRVSSTGEVTTVDRTGVYAVQTPQVLTRPALEASLAAVTAGTDELEAVERLVAAGELDGSIVLVAGSELARKVTYPHDLEVLTAILAGARSGER